MNMGHWAPIPLKSFGEFRNGVNFDKSKKGIGEIGLINVKDIFTDIPRIDFETLDKVDLASEKGIERFYVQAGDLFFVRSSVKRDGVGLVSMSDRANNEAIHCGFVIRFRPDLSKVNSRFLAYLLRSPLYRQRIIGMSGGSAIININQETLGNLTVDLPPFPTQRRIADILSAYDDLIENNTRRIRILEQMAQAIYQEWFGKVGKDSLPTGWELKPFSELVDIDPTTPVDKELEKPFIGMNALSETSMIIDLSLAVMRTGNSGAKFQNRDVLFPRITPSVENGKGAFVQFLKDGQVSIGSTEIIVFREKELNAEYIYFLSREHEFRGNAINSMVGASGRQRVQQKCFDGFMVAKPPRKLLEKFADVVSPMFKITHTLALKNTNLRQTRDLLLPRLVSGEIDV